MDPAAPELVDEARAPTDRCALHTRFRLHGGIVNVVKTANISPKYLQQVRKGFSIVVLGSKEHLQAVTERIVELQSQIAEQTYVGPAGCSLDEKERRTAIISKLQEENDQRTKELVFLRANIRTDAEDEQADAAAGSSPSESDTDQDYSENNGSGTIYQQSNESELEVEAEVLHFTSETFGSLQKIRVFEIESKDKLWRRPKVRQYFSAGILYRSREELKTTWDELFVDLFYVGVFAKASHLVLDGGLDWAAFNRFALVMFPILMHWRASTVYNNMFYHGDLYHKFLMFVSMASIMMMGNSTSYAFESDPALNTSIIFVGSYLVARIILALSQVVLITKFQPRFSPNQIPSIWLSLVSLVPYVVLLILPPDGSVERDRTRMIVWWVGVAADLLNPGLSISILSFWRNHPMTHRPAINIEHLTERYGSLVVISLGEIVVAFLYDHHLRNLDSVMGLCLLALLMAVNINSLYFRSEGSAHFQHALRRIWYTGVLWNALHFPLYTAIVTLGATVAGLIKVALKNAAKAASKSPAAGASIKAAAEAVVEAGSSSSSSSEPVSFGLRTLFAVSLAVVYFLFATLRMLHLHEPPSTDVPKDAASAAASPAAATAGDSPVLKDRNATQMTLMTGQSDPSVVALVEDGLQVPTDTAVVANMDEKKPHRHRHRHRRHRRHHRIANVSLAMRIGLMYFAGAVVLVCGFTVTEWSPDAWLGFAAAITLFSLLAEEWGMLKGKKVRLEKHH
ncbi:bacterial low temperature requirement A protein-domain-containing protein [Entophlyctis helioformis]|nr:bacterial low temperature requirement A protein-domain-containing protein [Entophlyctis helioformis]